MVYNANVPLSTDKLSSSQADLYNNFQAINTLVAVDHSGFNTANAGKHNKITFPIATAPAVSAAGFIGLYGANYGGIPQIWVNNVAPAHQIPMTAGSLVAEGWSYLPSGLIMKWGIASVAHGSGPLHNFPTGVGIPVFAALVSIQLTGIYVSSGDNSALWVASATTTGFTPASNSFAKNCYYLAIGY
jgi:hypothetical protein